MGTFITRMGRKGFSLYHMIKLLDLLSTKGPLGRSLISRELNIGEGSSRSLVKCLRSLGLIETDPVGGSYLTYKGQEILTKWRSIVTSSTCIEVRLEPSPWDLVSISCLHRSRSHEVIAKGILNIRDTIVREGCLGALIMGISGGYLYMLDTAGRLDVDISKTPLGSRILSLCGSEENAIVIAGASKDSCLEAEKCVWEAIALLLDEINIIKELTC